MAGPYPLATLGPTITAAGISVPSYNDVINSLVASFQAIYGTDAYLGNDSQDFQLLAVVAQGIDDCNQAAVTLYNAFSPSYAQGNQLSALVKINGLSRQASSFSSVNVLISGVVGTTINNGSVADSAGNVYNLPASVIIPAAGQILVTATAQQAGAINSPGGSVVNINTPTFGWQTVNNPLPSVQGAPVETDYALRIRQANSTEMPALAVFEGLVGTVANLSGVIAVAGYENPTSSPDANGLPPHSIAIVAQGGNAMSIAQAIALHKTPGTDTFGNTSQIIINSDGVPITINFFTPVFERILVSITIKALSAYTAQMGINIQAAIAAYLNSLTIGQEAYLNQLVAAAVNSGPANGFNVLVTQQAVFGNPLAAADIPFYINQKATCVVADITLTVT